MIPQNIPSFFNQFFPVQFFLNNKTFQTPKKLILLTDIINNRNQIHQMRQNIFHNNNKIPKIHNNHSNQRNIY